MQFLAGIYLRNRLRKILLTYRLSHLYILFGAPGYPDVI